MKQKLIFFDIDGTLLDDNKEISKETVQSIQKLKENGHTVAIATGRAPFAVHQLAEKLDIHTFVSLNGQFVIHEDQPIYTNPLDEIQLKRLVVESTSQSHPLVFVNDEKWESNVKEHYAVDAAIGSLQMLDSVKYNPESYLEGEKYQALLFCTEDEEASYRENYPEFDFVRWHEYSTDVLPKGGSKANGIQSMLDILGFDLNDVYAFGDGLNDIEMLSFIPNSVAMGNALPEVKRVAQYVTERVDENGITIGLEKLGLIK